MELKYKKHAKYMAIACLIIVLIGQFFLFFIFGFNFDFIDILFLALQLSIVILIPIGFRKIGRKSEKQLYITNKKIYVDQKYSNIDTIDSINLKSLKAIIFKKKRMDKGEDVGTIEFIPEYSALKLNLFTFSTMPGISKLQTVIESIIYDYADIEDRWDIIKNKLNIQFPYECKLSSQILDKINEKSKKRTIHIFLLIPLIIFGIIMIPITINAANNSLFRLLYYITFLPLAFGTIYSIYYIIQKRKWKKNASSQNSILVLDTDKISLINYGSSENIQFNSSTTLDFFKIEKWGSGPLKWKENLDGIIIKSSFDSTQELRFGPIDLFPDVFEAFFCYLIKWKKDKGLLLSKEKILKQESESIKQISEETKKEYPIKEFEFKKIEELRMEPISSLDPIYTDYKLHLDSDEEIFFIYEEKARFKKMILISSAILAVSLIIYITLIITNLRYATFLFSLLYIFSMVFCTISSICLCGGARSKYKMGNMKYIFTDKKILVDYPTGFCKINYNNISSIIQRPALRGNYVIEINLKTPIENNPYVAKSGRFAHLNEDKFHIYKIPPNNNLIEKLRVLNEKAQKEID
ncbi:MAG: hypothetical protein ACFFDK_09320 [Promethearchaeota archaeon]